jgi:hypothetical protein
VLLVRPNYQKLCQHPHSIYDAIFIELRYYFRAPSVWPMAGWSPYLVTGRPGSFRPPIISHVSGVNADWLVIGQIIIASHWLVRNHPSAQYVAMATHLTSVTSFMKKNQHCGMHALCVHTRELCRYMTRLFSYLTVPKKILDIDIGRLYSHYLVSGATIMRVCKKKFSSSLVALDPRPAGMSCSR